MSVPAEIGGHDDRPGDPRLLRTPRPGARAGRCVPAGWWRRRSPAATALPGGFFYNPGEIPAEFADAGLPEPVRYGLEGAFWPYGDADLWLDDEGRRELLLAPPFGSSPSPHSWE